MSMFNEETFNQGVVSGIRAYLKVANPDYTDQQLQDRLIEVLQLLEVDKKLYDYVEILLK